jgi:hypothetical protein
MLTERMIALLNEELAYIDFGKIILTVSKDKIVNVVIEKNIKLSSTETRGER